MLVSDDRFILARTGKFQSLLTSCIFHVDKEHFEPTIEKLFDLKSSAFIIREAWALDCQSHGESALLNEEKLRDRSAISKPSNMLPRRMCYLLNDILYTFQPCRTMETCSTFSRCPNMCLVIVWLLSVILPVLLPGAFHHPPLLSFSRRR